MKFIQNKNGSGEWHFSDEEIEIIKKNKKIVMSVSFLKDFKNILMKLIISVNENLPKNIRYQETKEEPKQG